MGQFGQPEEGNVVERKLRGFWNWMTSGGLLSPIKIFYVATLFTAIMTKSFDFALLLAVFGFLGREVALHAVDPTYKGHWILREVLGEPEENDF